MTARGGQLVETMDSLRSRVLTLEQALRLLHNESSAYRAHVVSWIAMSGDHRTSRRLEKALVQARLAATVALSGGSTPQCTCEVAPGDKLLRHDADCPARVACPDPSVHRNAPAEAVTHQNELRAALEGLVKQVKKVPGLDTAGAAPPVMAAQRACAVLDGANAPPESESGTPCRKCGRRSEPVPECIRNEARLAGHKWWCAACGYPVGCHYYDAQNAPPENAPLPPSEIIGAARRAKENASCPPTRTAHWRERHRGHGCRQDPDALGNANAPLSGGATGGPTEKQPDSSAPLAPAIPARVLCACAEVAPDGSDWRGKPGCAVCGGTGEGEAQP